MMKILMEIMLYLFLCPVERYRKTIREVHFFYSDLYENKGSYQPHRQPFEHHEAGDVGIPVSSVATNMQGLTLQECPKNETSKSDASPVRQAMDHGFPLASVHYSGAISGEIRSNNLKAYVHLYLAALNGD